MLKDNAKAIYKHLNSETFITADELAIKTKLSNRTVRSCLKEMKEPLIKQGVLIVSKPRFGYKLEIFDMDLFQTSTISHNDDGDIPATNVDRERYIMELLVGTDEYVKIDDLSELLYVSRGTITRAVKNIEALLYKFNLSFSRKSNRGIKIVGEEIDIRKFIEENLAVFSSATLNRFLEIDSEVKTIFRTINEVIRENQIFMPEVSYLRLIAIMIIQVNRISLGKEIELKKEEIKNYSRRFWKVIEETADKLAQAFEIEFSEGELVYLYLNFMSKGVYDFDDQNITIRNDIDELVDEMLEEVNRELQTDFRNDFELRMQLAQHLLPMDIRIKYDFYFDNPLIDEIKKKYTYAFNIASQSIVVLVKKYNKYIPQDEVGYLALIFQLAIERSEKEIEKLNILIICASGKGSSQLLKYKYKREFSAYLNNVFVCDIYQLHYFDFSKVDYVFTTVPLTTSVPLPVHEISLFLDDTDIMRVKNILSDNKIKSIDKFYKQENFIDNLEVTDKFDAIKKIVSSVEKQYTFSSDLYDSIVARENMAPTEFGNHIAMPHTLERVSKETIVYVAILSKPILWNKKKVQVIILTIMGNDKEEDMQAFYEVTTNLFYDRKGIEQLIEQKSYSYLLSLIKNS